MSLWPEGLFEIEGLGFSGSGLELYTQCGEGLLGPFSLARMMVSHLGVVHTHTHIRATLQN